MTADRVLGRGGSRALRRPDVGHGRIPTKPEVTPRHGQILSLQRVAGNQVVGRLLGWTRSRAATPAPAAQRTVTILSYNVGKSGPQHAELNVGAVRTAIQRAVPGGEQATILAALATADTQSWQEPDVVALATRLCAGTRSRPVDAVADAIGSTLTAEGTNQDERDQFEQARVAATSMSRAKGTPNQIALGPLDRTLRTAGIAGIKTAIGVLDDRLGTRQNALSETMVESWPETLAGGTLNVREAHGNAAGWLPTIDIATQLAVLRGLVDPAYNAENPAWKAAAGEPKVRFSVIHRVLPNAADKRYYAWASYADGVSPYIEFSVPGHKDLRVVFDFVNRRYYFTVHYKWHKGYNPFFLIV